MLPHLTGETLLRLFRPFLLKHEKIVRQSPTKRTRHGEREPGTEDFQYRRSQGIDWTLLESDAGEVEETPGSNEAATNGPNENKLSYGYRDRASNALKIF
jgi:hypothetical protein